MPAGRPPKPLEQKRRTGNPGKRPLPGSSLAVVAAVSPEPAFLDPFEVMVSVLEQGAPWLAATDATKLAMLRETLEERSVVRAQVMETGSPDLRKALRELDKQAASLLSECGFDPAARSRLGLAEVKAASKLEELRAKRQ
jgi:hypothetical protein